MKQAQSSLEEAETAGQLNNYILLFTLVTIVFVSYLVSSPEFYDFNSNCRAYKTPLSFLTSLFAIPFDYLPQTSDGEIRVDPHWFAERMGECFLYLQVL
jgi:hypothetical protein